VFKGAVLTQEKKIVFLLNYHKILSKIVLDS
jgi:hypothetical protein